MRELEAAPLFNPFYHLPSYIRFSLPCSSSSVYSSIFLSAVPSPCLVDDLAPPERTLRISLLDLFQPRSLCISATADKQASRGEFVHQVLREQPEIESLKSFIRTGKTASEVCISLRTRRIRSPRRHFPTDVCMHRTARATSGSPNFRDAKSSSKEGGSSRSINYRENFTRLGVLIAPMKRAATRIDGIFAIVEFPAQSVGRRNRCAIGVDHPRLHEITGGI